MFIKRNTLWEPGIRSHRQWITHLQRNPKVYSVHKRTPSSFSWTGDHNITHSSLKVHFNIILMSTTIFLCFSSSDKILESSPFSPTRTICPEHLIRIHLVSIILFSEECKLWSTSLCSCFHPPVTSYLLHGEVRKCYSTVIYGNSKTVDLNLSETATR